MALLAGTMCGVRNDSCSRKHKYARTSHGMASESLSRGVALFVAQELCFIKQEHGPPRSSKQAKTYVLLTTVLGPLRWCGVESNSPHSGFLEGDRGRGAILDLASICLLSVFRCSFSYEGHPPRALFTLGLSGQRPALQCR